MVARWSLDGLSMVSRWSLDGLSMVSRWSLDGLSMVSRWSHEVVLVRARCGPEDLSDSLYVDQCYLVTHVVFTLNNWGELMLDPNMAPHE
jgi:hypothetical protein